jgi:hypothetical protein
MGSFPLFVPQVHLRHAREEPKPLRTREGARLGVRGFHGRCPVCSRLHHARSIIVKHETIFVRVILIFQHSVEWGPAATVLRIDIRAVVEEHPRQLDFQESKTPSVEGLRGRRLLHSRPRHAPLKAAQRKNSLRQRNPLAPNSRSNGVRFWSSFALTFAPWSRSNCTNLTFGK